MTPKTSTETRKCLGCGRTLRSAAAIARGYGSGCWAKVRKAEATADLSAWTPAQVESARELIEDGGVVPSTREGVFHTVSTDGTEVHVTHRDGCTCTNGLLTRPSRPCLHRCAVVIILASQAPAVATAPALLRQPIALPAAIDEVALQTAMDRWNDAFMAMA
jgi:Family of unknown function (DUF6011)